MGNLAEWYAALRGNMVSVLAALAAVGAVFGLDITPGEQAGLVEGLDGLVAQVIALVAGANVVISKGKEALKNDPDIDTGSTTPGPAKAE